MSWTEKFLFGRDVYVRKDILAVFIKEHRELCLNRSKLATILGFFANAFFIFTDYFFGKEHFWFLLNLRGIFFTHLLLTFCFYSLFRKTALRWASFAYLLIGCSITVILTKMCLMTGNFSSLYFFGFVFVPLFCSAIIPWHPGYQIALAVFSQILYLSQLAFVGLNVPFGIFFTNNWFILSIGLVTSFSSYMQYKMRFQLKEKDQIKNDFFNNVSHELKTPVSLILAPTETALQALSGESRSPFRQQLETIRHNAYRLSAMIEDLLDLTRSEVGKVQLNPAKIQDTREYFERIFASVKPLMAEKGLLGEFVTGGPLPSRERGSVAPVAVEGEGEGYFDPAKIDKVVLNLLSNAIKFTPKGGKITMRVWDQLPLSDHRGEGRGEGGKSEAGEGVLKIQISDTGIGIPEDKLPHIFDRFMQVDASSTRAYGGMGIGLSLVKDFVELHGGTVTVESEVGKGTKFTVTLPRGKEQFRAPVVEVDEAVSDKNLPVLARIQAMQELRWDEESERDVGAPFMAPGEGGQGTVLVVDDNAEMRRALGEVLKGQFNVIFAGGGEEGLRIARERIPDLILSDIMMPEKDGYGLLQDLRADSNPQVREIPVIFLTAKSGEENLLFGFKIGADDYITKPFSPKEVLARVRNLIRARKQSEQIKTQADTVMKITSQVAHDIRSPLTSINACVRYWKENTPQESDHLTMLELSAKRLQGIADDLLKGHSDGEREKVVFSLHRVLDEMIGEYTSFRDLNRIRFRKLFDHAINCIGNRDRIQRAFGNLLKNAVEAIDGEGEVVIKSEIRGREAIVSISDTGRGMTSEVLRRILEGGHSEGKREGHGIGMKVVREVIQENGWRIEAESLPGRGSTFRIYFPVPDSKQLKDVPPMEEGAGAIEITVGEEGQVVVIDDDPAIRLQWELIGKKKGFGVTGFRSWKEYEKRDGTELYKGGTAIIDYHFDNSELNGMEIVRRLRKEGFKNLYLCTAEYWKPVIRERAKELGVTICPKPIPRVIVKLPSPHPLPFLGPRWG